MDTTDNGSIVPLPEFGYTGPQTLPVIQPRPVDPNWKCQSSGECCTIPKEVLMTKEEAALLTHHAPKEITLRFRPIHSGFVALQTGPCPLYAFQRCLVYEYRPFNCRRFACMRPDPKAEPFVESPDLTGCENANVRFYESEDARKRLKRIQKWAQEWAVKHGWSHE